MELQSSNISIHFQTNQNVLPAAMLRAEFVLWESRVSRAGLPACKPLGGGGGEGVVKKGVVQKSPGKTTRKDKEAGGRILQKALREEQRRASERDQAQLETIPRLRGHHLGSRRKDDAGTHTKAFLGLRDTLLPRKGHRAEHSASASRHHH